MRVLREAVVAARGIEGADLGQQLGRWRRFDKRGRLHGHPFHRAFGADRGPVQGADVAQAHAGGLRQADSEVPEALGVGQQQGDLLLGERHALGGQQLLLT